MLTSIWKRKTFVDHCPLNHYLSRLGINLRALQIQLKYVKVWDDLHFSCMRSMNIFLRMLDSS